jgi:hypothetical protein
VTKLQAQKSLTSLMEKGEIVGKMYGKTWVFCAKQVSPWLDLRIGVGGVGRYWGVVRAWACRNWSFE